MKSIVIPSLIAAASLMSATQVSAISPISDAPKNQLTLKQIMADPDWIGRAPQSPYWADDSQTIYFYQKPEGKPGRELYKVSVEGSEPSNVLDSELDTVDSATGDVNESGSLKVYTYQGDVFLKELSSGKVRPLILSQATESQAQFLTDGRVAFRRHNNFFAIDIQTGLIEQLVDIRLSDKPKDWQEPDDFLGKQQRRLFSVIRERQDNKQYSKQRREEKEKANEFALAEPFFLGKGIRIEHLSLSPKGDRVFVATAPSSNNDREDNMPRFITDDGYVENEKVRPLVGQESPEVEDFWVLSLADGKTSVLSKEKLPGIKSDPLKSLKKKAAKAKGEKFEEDKSIRPVYIHNWFGNGVEWNDDGTQLAIKLFSYDNKDRWIARVNFDKAELVSMHRLTNKAWVNDWTFNQMGWLPNSQTLFYLSEETGYSHLYTKRVGKRSKAVTKGKFEVSDVTVTKNGKHFYFRANKKHPGIYEVYRVETNGKNFSAVTDLGGSNDYELSPDEQSIAILHSTTTRPPELWVQSVNEPSPKALTKTVSSAFESIKWTKPQIIEVPSSHVDAPIYSRLYLPEGFSKDKSYPAVVFVHGAGYLQNAHQGWSGYFREFMFHSLLNQNGYIVLDMDYRASKGYGRDWRTAIYRQMGTPELEDLLDGKQWLVDNVNVEPNKVGIYGGSYGGFMTFMAMFNAPDAFAAGASLRPVTDWSSYNHGYTSNILNTPEVDPEAFNRSSPIEFADGLKNPLLIMHGMVDDNVFFKDSVRLVQKLIELEKTPLFETAIYPFEPHGFREPSSWLDEYTRIFLLFEEHVKK